MSDLRLRQYDKQGLPYAENEESLKKTVSDLRLGQYDKQGLLYAGKRKV